MKINTITYLLAICSVLLWGCSKEPQNPTNTKPGAQHSVLLTTATQGAPLNYISIGSVVSDQRIEISSRLSGYLRKLNVKEGDTVRAGQLLAKIDAADVEGAIRQAQAEVSAARAALADTQTDVQRFQSLFDQNNISENELRKARLRFDSATENVNQAQAALSTALAQREYTEIRSPFDASVVSLGSRAGDLLVPGRTILTLESAGALIFETFVPEQRLALIKIGAPVTLQMDALASPIQGNVIRIVRSGDPVTRSYPVKISLPNNPALMPGMFGRSQFALGQNDNLLIPKAAIVERGGLQGVFVVDDAKVAHFRWLRTGREWPDQIEVSAGLQANETLVAQAIPSLRDGDRVNIKTEQTNAQ
jgi:multidrug efflux system membrane fusion protein